MFENMDNLQIANCYKLQHGNKHTTVAIIVAEAFLIFQGKRYYINMVNMVKEACLKVPITYRL